VVDAVSALVQGWQRIAGARAAECLTAAVVDGEVVCYLVPRDREREYADRNKFSGAVGAYESMGVFIFSGEGEDGKLEAGGRSFEELWEILAAVRPEGVEQLRHE
jgi:hypothetical protein